MEEQENRRALWIVAGLVDITFERNLMSGEGMSRFREGGHSFADLLSSQPVHVGLTSSDEDVVPATGQTLWLVFVALRRVEVQGVGWCLAVTQSSRSKPLSGATPLPT